MKATARYWKWEEAFDKFGFQDGDGEVFTETVADTLATNGFECSLFEFGQHNTIIESISKDGEDYIHHDRVAVGYDDPRDYLATSIVDLLDTALPPP